MKTQLQNNVPVRDADAGTLDKHQSGDSADFVDNRESAPAQRQISDLASNGMQARRHSELAKMMDDSPRAVAQRHAARMIHEGSGSTPDTTPVAAARKKPVLQAKSRVTQLQTEITHTAGTFEFEERKGEGKKKWMVGKEMVAKLDALDPVKGTATGDNWTWMRALSYKLDAPMIRGHLLNHDLGGYAIPENLYPITSLANMDHKNSVEYPLKSALQKIYGYYQARKNQAGKITSAENRLIYTVTVNDSGLPFGHANFETKARMEVPKQAISREVGAEIREAKHIVRSTPNRASPIGKNNYADALVPDDWHHGERRQGKGKADELDKEQKALRDSKRLSTLGSPHGIEENVPIGRFKLKEGDAEAVKYIVNQWAQKLSGTENVDTVDQNLIGNMREILIAYLKKNPHLEYEDETEAITSLSKELQGELEKRPDTRYNGPLRTLTEDSKSRAMPAPAAANTSPASPPPKAKLKFPKPKGAIANPAGLAFDPSIGSAPALDAKAFSPPPKAKFELPRAKGAVDNPARLAFDPSLGSAANLDAKPFFPSLRKNTYDFTGARVQFDKLDVAFISVQNDERVRSVAPGDSVKVGSSGTTETKKVASMTNRGGGWTRIYFHR